MEIKLTRKWSNFILKITPLAKVTIINPEIKGCIYFQIDLIKMRKKKTSTSLLAVAKILIHWLFPYLCIWFWNEFEKCFFLKKSLKMVCQVYICKILLEIRNFGRGTVLFWKSHWTWSQRIWYWIRFYDIDS